MITGLDRTTLLVRDLEAAITAYRKILAREPALLATDDGLEGAIFALDNTTLRLASPKGAGAAGEIARARLDGVGEGLVEFVFRVDDIDRSFRRLRRLSLSPDEVSEAAASAAGERHFPPRFRMAWTSHSAVPSQIGRPLRNSTPRSAAST